MKTKGEREKFSLAVIFAKNNLHTTNSQKCDAGKEKACNLNNTTKCERLMESVFLVKFFSDTFLFIFSTLFSTF
jgi:hypothetical protein